MGRRISILIAAAICGSLCMVTSVDARIVGSKRPVQVSDVFEREGLSGTHGGAASFSPNAAQFAIVRMRPQKHKVNFNVSIMGSENSDVWLHGPDGRFVNLTHGEKDGSGWWSPKWSPDGRYLAMLSTRGDVTGQNVWLWVWDSHSGNLRRLTKFGVNSDAWESLLTGPHVWLDAEHILCPTLPEGERPEFAASVQGMQQAAFSAWAAFVDGKKVTASVLDAGQDAGAGQNLTGMLLKINVSNGNETVVSPDTATGIVLSPDGRYFAYARQIGLYEQAAKDIATVHHAPLYTVEVADASGRTVLSARGYADDYAIGSLRWSNDGDHLAFLAHHREHNRAPRLVVAHLGSGTFTDINLGQLDLSPSEIYGTAFPEVEWTAAGDILARGIERSDGRTPPSSARRDWWIISLDGTRRNVTRGMKSPPQRLFKEHGGDGFIGLAVGEVWRLSPSTGSVENLTKELNEKVEEIVWPWRHFRHRLELGYARGGTRYDRAVLEVGAAEEKSYYRISLPDNRISRIDKPDEGASLLAVSHTSDEIIFVRDDQSGFQLWHSAKNHSKVLARGNLFLRELEEAPLKKIVYTNSDGQRLVAWIITPLDYDPAKRYPLITWVYPGTVQNNKPPHNAQFGMEFSVYNMQIPAANGYAVLLPSIPHVMGNSGDLMLSLAKNVMPAVEKAVELGIADPSRLFLMGHSMGGFATYGLVTQTDRFRAAVAMAGMANWTSLYGQFDIGQRYTYGERTLSYPSVETRRGWGAPWNDTFTYLKNSPVFFLDKVSTPLMIVHGDMDYISLQQGEEIFSGLRRLGRRARFVRYWGEGHIISSPANAKDMWQRIFTWFKENSTQEEK